MKTIWAFLRKTNIFVKLAGLVVLIGIGWFVYTSFFSTTTSVVQYQTATVEKGTIVSSVSASGQVSSSNNTPIVTQVTGAITKLYVKNGDEIKAGSPIATLELDQDSMQKYIQQLSSFQSSQNSLQNAKSSLQSLKSSMIASQQNFIKSALNKGKTSGDPTYDQLKADKQSAEDKYNNQEDVINQAQTSLNSASMALRQVSPTIYAPISGTITGLAYQVGSVIPAQAVSGSSTSNKVSQTIANVTTSAFPIVTVNLTEIDIPKVQIGSKATLTFDAFPGKTFTGKVFSINTTGAVSSGVTTYPTTITLDVANPQIYSNMSVSANIIIDTKSDVLFVPTAAVQSTNGSTTVRVLKNRTPENVEVVTGLSSDTSTEIVSGLSLGDQVVTAVINPTTSSSSTASPFSAFRLGGAGGANRAIGR